MNILPEFLKKQLVLSIISILFLGLVIQTAVFKSNYFIALAQCIDASNPRADYLISSTNQSNSNNFKSRIGNCIIDPSAAIGTFQQQTYALLYDEFFNKSSVVAAKKITVTSMTLPTYALTDGNIYHVNGDVIINGDYPNGTAAVTSVIFVEGNLYVMDNFNYEDSVHGIVFVVKGGTYFNYSPSTNKIVTNFSGVIIDQGDDPRGASNSTYNYSICTAVDMGATFTTAPTCDTTPFSVGTKALLINGSIIALEKAKPIRFVRKLNDNAIAAEQINQQIKYLVILNNVLARPTNIISEGTSYAICTSTAAGTRAIGCSCTADSECITANTTHNVTCQTVGVSSQKVCQQTGDTLPGGGSTPAPSPTPTPLPSQTPSPSPFPAQLVAYWKLDESSGQLGYDSVGNTVLGISGTTVVSGKFGYARSIYNGSAMSANDSPVFGSQSISVSMWVFPKNFTNANTASLYNYRNGLGNLGFNMQISSTGLVDCQATVKNGSGTSTNNVTSSGAMSLNQWNHVVCTYDGRTGGSGKTVVYVNNVSTTPSASTVGLPLNIPSGASVVIGKNISTNVTFLGYLDDIRVYSYALSSTEVGAIYTTTVSAPAPWTFTNPWQIPGLNKLFDFVGI